MLFPKFIIDGEGDLILGKVKYHHQLSENPETIKGGGFFKYDSDSCTFYLSGTSHDYGSVDIDDLKIAISNNFVYTNKYKTHNLTLKSFFFNTETEQIKLNCDFYCQSQIELKPFCNNQCEHCKNYYSPIEGKSLTRNEGKSFNP